MIQVKLPLRFFRGKKSRKAEHQFHMEKQTSKNYQEKSERRVNKRELALPDVNIYYKSSLVKIYYKVSLIKKDGLQ